mgnify:FL=1
MRSCDLVSQLSKNLSRVKEDLPLLKDSIYGGPNFRNLCKDLNHEITRFEDALTAINNSFSDILDDVFKRFHELSDDKKVQLVEGITGMHIFPKSEFNDFMSKKLNGNYFEVATAVARARCSSNFNPNYSWFSWKDNDRYALKGDQAIEFLIKDRVDFVEKITRDKNKLKILGYSDKEIEDMQYLMDMDNFI